MLSSMSPNSLERSSLEEMLDSLRRRDENEKPKDIPPELPARPKPTRRSRLPSVKRPLPGGFETGENGNRKSKNLNKSANHVRRSSFGGQKDIELDLNESPYIKVTNEKESEPLMEQNDVANVDNSSTGSTTACIVPEGNDNIGYFIKKKLRVWCQLKNEHWELGQILSSAGEKASVLLADGNAVSVPIKGLLPANPEILEGVDDLIQLSYLNEPSVIQNLHNRFSRDVIYSKAGPVLVAINPFKDVHIYGDEYVTAYKQKLVDSPHVYAIADAAFTEMMRDGVNQSLIISGESGAGKTETAKIAMQYLATLGGSSSGVECEVLKTSCVLEAFGNAKTSRNDNSSRFGKLIEIHFSGSGKICGAKIQTFLLEKSRVVQLAQGERSYHVFYQLCAGAPDDLREKLKLEKASEFKYLNQSDCLAIHNVDDAQKFHLLTEALDTLRICKEDQENIFEMLAAVLWLGNISFEIIDTENHAEVVRDEALVNACNLIGCTALDLVQVFSTRKIQAGKDKVAKRLTLQQAIDTRDAFAKFIYASLFDWLVEEINKSLSMGKHCTGRFISILDIYGFESFKKNSFEQLCINYANERLQQHFNRHLFKLEQEEYVSDGIDWMKIDFEDNQECLNLIEKKPIGLLSLLDEESNFPKANDLTLATKLKQHLGGSPCFITERIGTFSIRHYAGKVVYDTAGFLEKNRDPLHSDTVQLLSSCSRHLSQVFASLLVNHAPISSAPSLRSGPMAQKQSVATKFKGQLFKLMQQLEKTTPHFIRCIKPNNKQLPGTYEKELVSEQLRSCGVLEVVRIARSGFPTRMTHQEFTTRYGFLLSNNNANQDPLSTSVAILQQFGVLPEMYQIGYKRLYFRAGQVGVLENTRKQVLQGTLEVQKCFRGLKARRYFHELKDGVITLQSFVRGEIARGEFRALAEWVKQDAQIKLDTQLSAVLQIQSLIRGWLARKHFQRLSDSKIVILEKRKRGGRKLSNVLGVSIENLPANVEELQQRVVSAETNLGKKEKENGALREQVRQYEARWLEYEAKMKSMEDMWQKQMVSLQISLAAAKKSLGADQTPSRKKHESSTLSPQDYDSEDALTPTGGSTPPLLPPVRVVAAANNNNCFDIDGGGGGQEINGGGLNTVSLLAKEFEHRKHNFDEEANAIVETKHGQNLYDEIRRLKRKFETWKKDYKARLREAKAKAKLQHQHKSGPFDVEKISRKWWGKMNKKA